MLSNEKHRNRADMPFQSTHIRIKTPRDFNFQRTAFSHGWYALPPFSFERNGQKLGCVFQLNDGTVVSSLLRGMTGGISVQLTTPAPLSTAQRNEVIALVRTCLRLDEDFTEFHNEAGKHAQFKWIARSGAGRMLRSPTVFEDVVKMICTTNCTWALTTLMVSNLVHRFGQTLNGTAQAFPPAETIAGTTERVMRKEIKAGYRSPYLIELAERVASKELDIESWRNSSLSTEDLFKEIRNVKGIGPYAAGNIMKLVGRYDYLGLDSWVRAKYYELHRNGRKVKDSTIEKHYERFGKWRGLLFWLEMTRYWHEDKFRGIP